MNPINLIEILNSLIPDVKFVAGSNFSWSPEDHQVTYKPFDDDDSGSTWSLLHEASHALLKHDSYKNDFDLLMVEVAAWEKAKALGLKLNISIDEDHIQDCLDTYRDWLHQRATCPKCATASFQSDNKLYSCHNCRTEWSVSKSRFCRSYRLQKYL